MAVLSDVALPRVDVSGSTIAYSEAGDAEAPLALFCTEIRLRPIYGGISFRWLRRLRIALRRI